MRAHTRIGDGSGGLPGGLLDPSGGFGASAACLGDLDGDGIVDLIAGAPVDDDGGLDLGAVWVLFLQDGPVPWSNQGHGLAGTGGEPAFWGTGALAGDDPFSLHLVEARPGALAGLFLGFSALFAPFEGGVFVPAPDELFLVATDAQGAFSAGAVWPPGLPAGTEVFFQFWIVDPQGPFGLAASNGLGLSTP